MNTQNLNKYLNTYAHNLMESVVPFWDNSLDTTYGGQFTGLERDGAIYDTKKYIWLQGRAIWTYAKLFTEIEQNDSYLQRSMNICNFVEKFATDTKGRYLFSVTQQGQPYYFQPRHASAEFCALGFLQLGVATGNDKLIIKAEQLFEQILRWIQQPGLLDLPQMDGNHIQSDLGAQMGILGALTEFAQISNKDYYAELAQECYQALENHFSTKHGVFLENYAGEQQGLNWPELRHFNPGHSIEMGWFILEAQEYFPNPKLKDMAITAIENSLEMGWDKEYGGIYYFLDVDNKPMLPYEWNMKHWWPHAEALYACLLAYEFSKKDAFLLWHERIHDYTFQHFVDHEYGEWFGYLDRSGNVTHTAKGGHYKGFYHVPRTLMKCKKLLEQKI